MHHSKLDLQDAVDWAYKYHQDKQHRFVEAMKCLPSFGATIDWKLKAYVNGISAIPRGNYCWNFESGRYFGNKGQEIQQSRLVPLLPKVVDREPGRHDETITVALVQL